MRAASCARACWATLRLVQVEYIQSGLATKLEDAPQNNRLRWLLDPARSGLALVMSAIGCHAQHLACFAAGPDDRARVRGRRRADAGTPGDRLHVGADRVRRRRARHVHGRRRRRPAARTTSAFASTARKACSTGRIASAGYLTAVAAGRGDARDRPRRSRACPRTSSRRAARRAAIPKACARRSRTSTPTSRTSASRARSACRRRRSRIRASRTARTRWRSSRRASRRRHAAAGSTWRECRADVRRRDRCGGGLTGGRRRL